MIRRLCGVFCCAAFVACGARSELDAMDASAADALESEGAPASDGSPPMDAADAESAVDATISLWPRVWGATGNDLAEAVTVGPDGSVVVVGIFEGTVDFDANGAGDAHTSNGGWDVFVTKLTADGGYLWTRTWGSPPTSTRDDEVHAVAAASDGSIVVAGTFATTVDFDPGPGVDAHGPAGNDFSAYVSKLDGAGNHVWTRTWGSPSRTNAWGVGAAPDGSVFVAGAFDGTVDLDPGPGTDAHVSNGDIDAYVSKLDGSGAFEWGRAWGGAGAEENAGRLGVDGNGKVTVTGSFQSTVDFDPGPGVDDRTALGAYDLFVIQFAADGTRTWARTVDTSTGAELPASLAVASNGSIAVSGFFYGTVDFGPNDARTSGAQYDAFVLRLDGDGGYAWTATYGGAVFEARSAANAVAIDDLGRVIAGGSFYRTVDFDPGPGIVSRTAAGNGATTDMYVLRLRSDGAFDAVQTWGGVGDDDVLGVAEGVDDSTFAVGAFSDSVNFSTTASPDVRTSHGQLDAFALRWTP